MPKVVAVSITVAVDTTGSVLVLPLVCVSDNSLSLVVVTPVSAMPVPSLDHTLPDCTNRDPDQRRTCAAAYTSGL